MKFWACVLCSFLYLFSLSYAPVTSASTQSTATAKKQVAKKQNVKKQVAKKQPAKQVAAKKSTRKVVAKAKPAPKVKPKKVVARKQTSSTSRKFAASNQRKQNYIARRPRVRGPSYAQLQGLRGSSDPLGLSTTAVLAYDMNTNEVLYEKNADEPLPIASITKLMTALVIVESGVDLNQKFKVTREDFVASSARSKLRNGAVISRRQAMHLALMSSDNRAAHFLARTYPGGVRTFIRDMNTKAAMLGMSDSVFYDSIGLNNGNRSSALDLSRLLASAAEYEIIRDLSTTPQALIPVGKRALVSRTTNSFVTNPNWDVELQKTGLTTAAGYCMVMQAIINGRTVAMVFLDAPNKAARSQDAERLRLWLSGSSFLQASNSK